MLARLRGALFGPTLELQSPLTPDACPARLRERTDPPWKIFGTKPVVGSVRRRSFSGYKRIWYGNAFRTFVFAEIGPDTRGAIVTLRFGISRFSMSFIAFWFTCAILIGVSVTLFGIKDYVEGSAKEGEWLMIVVPPLLVPGGAGIVLFGRWLGRSERPFLIEFINDVLRTSETS